MEMADSNAARRRRRGGCGLALGRLLRRLSKMLCTAAAARPSASAGAASRRCQYDPLSYARNFDRNGFGTDDDVVSHYYTFASRFVLASSARPPQ